jgi:hypothetical protein
MNITEINAVTGEVIEREATAAEAAEFTYQAELHDEAKAEQELQKAALEAKKQEVLTRLGITADEAAALLS